MAISHLWSGHGPCAERGRRTGWTTVEIPQGTPMERLGSAGQAKVLKRLLSRTLAGVASTELSSPEALEQSIETGFCAASATIPLVSSGERAMFRRLHGLARPGHDRDRSHWDSPSARLLGTGSAKWDIPPTAPSHGGARLQDPPVRRSSGKWRIGYTIWLPPIVVACSVAALLVATGTVRSIQICDSLRALGISAPGSCRQAVWVKAKTRTVMRPVVTRDKLQRKQRRS